MDAIGTAGNLATSTVAAQFNGARVDATNSIRRQEVSEQEQTTVQGSGGSSGNNNLPPNVGRNVDIRA